MHTLIPCQGEYREGDPHGTAIFIEADGRAFEESWKNGKRESRKLISKVQYSYATPAAATAAGQCASAEAEGEEEQEEEERKQRRASVGGGPIFQGMESALVAAVSLLFA